MRKIATILISALTCGVLALGLSGCSTAEQDTYVIDPNPQEISARDMGFTSDVTLPYGNLREYNAYEESGETMVSALVYVPNVGSHSEMQSDAWADAAALIRQSGAENFNWYHQITATEVDGKLTQYMDFVISQNVMNELIEGKISEKDLPNRATSSEVSQNFK